MLVIKNKLLNQKVAYVMFGYIHGISLKSKHFKGKNFSGEGMNFSFTSILHWHSQIFIPF